jgi:signal transduction histidine kinase
MKLSAQYSRVNLIVAVSILFIAGVVYYATINYIADSQIDESLANEYAEVSNYISINHRLPKPFVFDEDQSTYFKTERTVIPRVFYDTVYRNPREKETEAGRAMTGLVTLKGQNYKIVIVESRESVEYLVQIITMITLALIAVLLIVLTIINRYILAGLWRPFYHILSQLQAFDIADINKVDLYDTQIDEFASLNSAVLSMSSRVKNEYQNLKIFTENASHEMMTPIAVITSKLDTLIQDETLKADQYAQITDIYAANGKLSRLNQSLLLLVKIENDLIQNTSLINIKDVVEEKLRQFNELTENKKIAVNYQLEDKKITASSYLIDILINNLFTNAIRHGETGGQIDIELTDKALQFKNTAGREGALNPDHIFERFQKGKTSEGTGLGLTIARNICLQYNMTLSYAFEPPMHNFKITF